MTLTRNKKGGFSLVEFLIVVGILAVLAAITVPLTVGIINKSNNENDEVLAGVYTEYMQKFATEKAGDAGFYETIYDDGAGSEYEVLANKSGAGAYPGVTALDERINDASTEELVWKQIRKEACIAIKAYGDAEIADNENYFISKPNDTDKAFVYYYLTGKIELKEVSQLHQISIDEVNEGTIDTEDYWVFLDRAGGSGKAVGLNPDQRDFYVKVIIYGAAEPLNGAKVTLNFGKYEKNATTTETGMIVFRDVEPVFTVSAEKLGGLTFADEEYYGEDYYALGYPRPNVNLTNNNTVGTFANPYVIAMKVGTLGSLELRETVKNYNALPGSSVGFNQTYQKVEEECNFYTTFTKEPYSTMGRDETYKSHTTAINPIELLGPDETNEFKFLMHGQYKMKIESLTNNPKTNSPYYLTYNEGITSALYGIYNTENPQPEYVDNSAPYPYPVVLKRRDTVVRGYLIAENPQQPLHGTKVGLAPSENFDGNVPSKNNQRLTIETFVRLRNVENPNEYYDSEILTPLSFTSPDGSNVYAYEVEILNNHTGQKYVVELHTRYGEKSVGGGKNVTTVAQWPTTIEANGDIHNLTTTVSTFTPPVVQNPVTPMQSGSNVTPQGIPQQAPNIDGAKMDLQTDVATTNFRVKVQDRLPSSNVLQWLSYQVSLQRLGYSTPTNLTHIGGQVVRASSQKGIATFNAVKKGYYLMTIEYDPIYKYEKETYLIFVDDGDYVIEHIGAVEYDYVIDCFPVTANGHALSGNGMLAASSKYGYKAIQFTITIDGQEVTLYNVDYETYSNNRTRITFKYGATSDELKVVQAVDCFKGTDMLHVTRATTPEDGIYEFNIHRLEDIASSDTQHPINTWYWSKEVTNGKNTHTENCAHCRYTRKNGAHYSLNDIDGVVKSGYESYYTKEVISHDLAIFDAKQHVKHCSVCDIYDELENCVGGEWTPYYNSYINSGDTHANSSHDSASGKDYIELQKNSAPNISNINHYKYCTDCFARVASGSHESRHIGDDKEFLKISDANYSLKEYLDKDNTNHIKHCNLCNHEWEQGSHSYGDTYSLYYKYDETSKDYIRLGGLTVDATHVQSYRICNDCGHIDSSEIQPIHQIHVSVASCTDKNGAHSNSGLWSGCDYSSPHCWKCGNYGIKKEVTETKNGVTTTTTVTERAHESWCNGGGKWMCPTCTECGGSRVALYIVGEFQVRYSSYKPEEDYIFWNSKENNVDNRWCYHHFWSERIISYATENNPNGKDEAVDVYYKDVKVGTTSDFTKYGVPNFHRAGDTFSNVKNQGYSTDLYNKVLAEREDMQEFYDTYINKK